MNVMDAGKATLMLLLLTGVKCRLRFDTAIFLATLLINVSLSSFLSSEYLLPPVCQFNDSVNI